MFNSGLKAITTEEAMSCAKAELFVKPLADTFTFGLYSSLFCGPESTVKDSDSMPVASQ
jgi:hypothetical protein